MAYRWNGVECDTFEELQRLQGVARTTSAVVKETRKKRLAPLEIERTLTDREVELHNSQLECDKGPDV